MNQQIFETGEHVVITYTSQIICQLSDGKYLVRGFAYPLSAEQLEKVNIDDSVSVTHNV